MISGSFFAIICEVSMELGHTILNLKSRITKLHYDKNAEGFFLDLLEFFSLFYGLATKFRNKLYDNGTLKEVKVNAEVISVGNLTTGGVGKTPIVQAIASYYVDKGEKVAVISRGYGGKLSNKKVNVISDGINLFYNADMAGDEAYMLAVNLNMCAVLTCKDRVKAAKYALEKLGVNKIILDDGFQYRRLHRDLNLLLIDSEMGFGNEKLLPAGPLREGTEAFDRIDKIIVVNKSKDNARAEKLAKVMGKKFGCESFVCYTFPDYVYNIKTGDNLVSGEAVTAMCAIGQPSQFYRFLEKDYEILDKVTFDDHHRYVKSDIAKIKGNIITTEKDAVKLAKFDRDNIFALKLKHIIDVEGLLSK